MKLATQLLKYLGLTILAYAIYQLLNIWAGANVAEGEAPSGNFWAPIGGFVIVYALYALRASCRYFKTSNSN